VTDSPLFWLMLLLSGSGPAFLIAGVFIGKHYYRDQLAACSREVVHVKWHCDVFDEVLTQLVSKTYVRPETLRTLIGEAERKLQDPAGYTGGHSLAEHVGVLAPGTGGGKQP
jgi:hypothetical protein